MGALKVLVSGVWVTVVPGVPGPTGPTGPLAPFYQQTSEPAGPPPDGTLWYDTDDNTGSLVGPTGPSGPPGSGATENVNTVATSGSAQTIPDVTSATMHRITLSTDCTFTFPTAVAGKSFSLILAQDATGGRQVVWPASVQWVGLYGSTPVLTITATKVDVFSFTCANGTNWLGMWAGSTS